ncbi:MAG: hypothetical protein HUK08_04395, partial [Bacteroidaceae bacterium]|nr:hypothetical protein [Bacteroidaceae bacterium]
KCQKACPVDNIAMDRQTNTPQWLHNRRCLTCFACYHTCPNHAISFNGRITKNKGQYNTLMKK